jgi:ADP-ribose pyrophosphatase YjhB (NUDIX family)
MEEETGLHIRPTALLGIYVDTYGTEDEYTLNIHYLAEVVSGEPRPASDISELAWFAPHELPPDLAFRSDYEALADWQRAMQASSRRWPWLQRIVSDILNLKNTIETLACTAMVMHVCQG